MEKSYVVAITEGRPAGFDGVHVVFALNAVKPSLTDAGVQLPLNVRGKSEKTF
jgi:hypothetical protein